MNKKEIIGLIFLMFVAFLVRAWFLTHAGVVTPDEAYNIRMGQEFAAGNVFDVFCSDHRRQPVPTFLFGFASKIGQDRAMSKFDVMD